MPNQKDTAVDNYFALFRSPRKEGNGADGPEPHPPPKANWGGVFSSVMLSLGSQPSTLEPKAGSSRSGEGGSRPPRRACLFQPLLRFYVSLAYVLSSVAEKCHPTK